MLYICMINYTKATKISTNLSMLLKIANYQFIINTSQIKEEIESDNKK